MDKEIETPLVSIVCDTYNHVNYIRQCLDGFLMQETNFPIEILVHDDASTDGTADIVKEYESRYPNLIKPIYQTENQYSKGVKVTLEYQYSRAKGKYIAFCEGDDYWTDPLKLQKQVDFLESNPDCILTCHHYKILNGIAEDGSANWIRPISTFDLKYYIGSEWFIQPLTVVFRAKILDLNEYRKYECSKDVTLFYYLLRHGKGYFFQDEMAVYRLHSGGTYSNLSWEKKLVADLRTINAISVVENDENAATLLKRYLDKTVEFVGRKTLLKEWRLFCGVLRQLRPYYGGIGIIRLLLKLDSKS